MKTNSNMKEDSEELISSQEQSTCAFFVLRKKRFCKMLVSKGNKYCGQHLLNENQEQDSIKKRIPCPLDSKHNCFEQNLVHHLARCNAKEREGIPYMYKGINEGEEDNLSNISLSTLSDDALQSFLNKVHDLHQEFVECIEERIRCHPKIDAISDSFSGAEAIRHLKQNSSLLAYMEDSNILNFEGPKVFLEFGAGRGHLTSYLIEAIRNLDTCTFVLIDKSAQRFKVDSKLRQRKGVKIERLRINIEDLNLMEVESIKKSSSIIGCGKHLCGAATDFTLRSLSQCAKESIGGVVIALCCHHRATWKSYTGKKFFKKIGLTKEDFSVLLSLTSWAVSGEKNAKIHAPGPTESPTDDTGERSYQATTENTVENRYTRMGLSVSFREEIGRMVKQIIDMGRVHYLRELGLEANLIQYAERSLTLENIALVADRKRQPSN